MVSLHFRLAVSAMCTFCLWRNLHLRLFVDRSLSSACCFHSFKWLLRYSLGIFCVPCPTMVSYNFVARCFYICHSLATNTLTVLRVFFCFVIFLYSLYRFFALCVSVLSLNILSIDRSLQPPFLFAICLHCSLYFYRKR